eukprot:TRINITY_DN1608_c0_g1_i1.p1 TRINITY_DN1608_c0_g1~~TRINITY_DN1608_c0_g1_i1.p1  ORF type:complete len:324 (+),score=74.60 TRINITY_DN1608_c0_g1_i1:66-1037(+)
MCVSAPAASLSPAGGKAVPAVRVECAKVYFTMDCTVVKYVLEVSHAGRGWRVERSFSEIRELARQLTGVLPELPPFRFRYWRTNDRWSKISQRRAALDGYFTALSRAEETRTGKNLAVYASFLSLEDHMYPLDTRPPAPDCLDTVWWCSWGDMGAHIAGIVPQFAPVGGGLLSAIPNDVWLCSPHSAVVRDGEHGVRIHLPTATGLTTSTSVYRRRVIENAVFYGWISAQGDRIPLPESVREVMAATRLKLSRKPALIRPCYNLLGSRDTDFEVSSLASEELCMTIAVTQPDTDLEVSSLASEELCMTISVTQPARADSPHHA